MLFEQQVIADAKTLASGLDENVFLYCTIKGISLQGGNIDASFLSCTISNLDAYWGIFNMCTFVQCKFEDCTFRGTAFPDCKFVECSFKRCAFLKDNLDAPCNFDRAKSYGGSQTDCSGLDALVHVA
jgi:uncharacterized protein YjbI with pentapeptide repeats